MTGHIHRYEPEPGCTSWLRQLSVPLADCASIIHVIYSWRPAAATLSVSIRRTCQMVSDAPTWQGCCHSSLLWQHPYKWVLGVTCAQTCPACTQVCMDDGSIQLCSRNVAVIYYLTKDWAADDGGLLIDHEAAGGPHTYIPKYNRWATWQQFPTSSWQKSAETTSVGATWCRAGFASAH